MSTEAHEDIDLRRRRCLYRALHRGTKEMDWLLGSYAQAHLPAADAAELTFWERLVQLPDPQLYDWIMGHEATDDPSVAAVVSDMRRFHHM